MGFIREVGPFVGIVLVVVEFLAAISVTDVAPFLGTDGVVLKAVSGDGGGCPFGRRSSQKFPDACAFDMFGNWESCEIAKCWIDAHEVDGAFANSTGFGDTGNDPNERRAGGLLPKREFAPVFFLAQVPAVIAPKANDGVGGVRRFIESVDQSADLAVEK